jgi:hypothetical protein
LEVPYPRSLSRIGKLGVEELLFMVEVSKERSKDSAEEAAGIFYVVWPA